MQIKCHEKSYPKFDLDACLGVLRRFSTSNGGKESIGVATAIGRVVATDLHSPVDIPKFNCSIVDGFAIGTEAIQGDTSLKVSDVCITGSNHLVDSVQAGTACYVTTGARLPRNTLAVLPFESCLLDGGFVTIPAESITGDMNVRLAGSDTKQGSLILRKGQRIGPAELSLLHACEIQEIPVYDKVRIAILSTGAEVESEQVGDANRPYLISRLSQIAEVVDMGACADDRDFFQTIVDEGNFDVLITSGSVSRGTTDFMKTVLEESPSFNILFGQVNLKPGKPTTVAISDAGKFVFALPGNPASCFVTFNLLVLPVIEQLSGSLMVFESMKPTMVRIVGVESIQPDLERPEFLRGTAFSTPQGSLNVRLVDGHQRSSRAASYAPDVNCLVKVPPSKHLITTEGHFEAYMIGDKKIEVGPVGENSQCITTESKAAAFDSLVEWLKMRSDVENIDLMNLAGFCRNCLSKWLVNPGCDLDQARRYVYGMDYDEWKQLYRKGEKREHAPRYQKPVESAARRNPCASSIITPKASWGAYVLTISDRASRGEYEDSAGPLISKWLTAAGASLKGTRIIPDDISEIQTVIKDWTRGGTPSVIVTTGGTGFGSRDFTPESVSQLLEKPAPGIIHSLLQKFSGKDPLYCLSRPVAGVIGKTFIVTLPGRPEAVEDGMSVIAPLLGNIVSSLGS
jgi:molybdenum cofactor synthesis domain-containing protein